jgi:hypothetical protein
MVKQQSQKPVTVGQFCSHSLFIHIVSSTPWSTKVSDDFSSNGDIFLTGVVVFQWTDPKRSSWCVDRMQADKAS